MLNRKNLSQIKCIVAQDDAVLTDGTTWLNHLEHKHRKFSVRDSIVRRSLRKAGDGFAAAYTLKSRTYKNEIFERCEKLGAVNFVNLIREKFACMLKGKFGITQSAPNSPQIVKTSVEHITAKTRPRPWAVLEGNHLMNASSRLCISILIGIFPLVFVQVAGASETIKFPEEELATESVLPVFENPMSVKNRTVQTAKRFEVGLMGGMALNEPFANPFSAGGEVSYHLDEDQAINLYATYFIPGTTHYVDQINQEAKAHGINALNLQNAPMPKYLALVSYQYTAYYGKLSITKNYIVNLSTYLLGGAGGFAIGDSLNPAVALGFGQKFYFSPNFALRFDLRALIYQGPDVVGTGVPAPTAGSSGEVPSSAFSKRIFTDSMLSLGAVYLIPNS